MERTLFIVKPDGVQRGLVGPILARLEAAGWLVKEREQIDPVEAGRPVRRLYRLSPEGALAARRALVGVQSRV